MVFTCILIVFNCVLIVFEWFVNCFLFVFLMVCLVFLGYFVLVLFKVFKFVLMASKSKAVDLIEVDIILTS